MEKKKEIDYSQTLNEDDVIDVIEPLNGIHVLLDGLIRINEDGYSSHTKDAYRALQILCEHIGKDLQDMKPKVNYMQTKIRED